MSQERGIRTQEGTAYVGLQRKFPVGAEVIGERVDFRVWAPDRRRVDLVIERPESRTVPMTAEGQGYFSCEAPDLGESVLYRFRLDGGEALLPDPASRFQPDGPDGPSEVIDPTMFAWTDEGWPGPRLEGQVLYEMHVGTFTPEGSWRSASRQLAELAAAGVSAVELMPIAEFAGRFGWGYDGVDLFAPSHLYGQPDDLRSFINAAHELGLAVLLDVVYNHFGPAGNYFREFSETYFTDRYQCEWGPAINYDGPGATPVRDFVVSNACYWIDEFHFDGFRLDATQQIFDASKPGIVAEIAEASRRTAAARRILMIAENEPQRTELLASGRQDGAGLDALWNDDFQHSLHVALTGRAEAYYSDYRGSAQELISVARHGYLYQGQRSRWQNKPRGAPALEIEPARFVCYLENHDQVANSAWGTRIAGLISSVRHRAITTYLLLGPWTPLVFQGQEFAASTPFLYFADHGPDIAGMVGDGRREFLSQFPSLAGDMQRLLPNPSNPRAFEKSKLNLDERQANSAFYTMFKDLVKLRRTDAVFGLQGELGVDGAVLSDHAFVLRFFGHGEDRLLVVNLGMDLHLAPVPEPLLAPPRGQVWVMTFCSEQPTYGGGGIGEVQVDDGWRIPAETALVFGSRPMEQ